MAKDDEEKRNEEEQIVVKDDEIGKEEKKEESKNDDDESFPPPAGKKLFIGGISWHSNEGECVWSTSARSLGSLRGTRSFSFVGNNSREFFLASTKRG